MKKCELENLTCPMACSCSEDATNRDAVDRRWRLPKHPLGVYKRALLEACDGFVASFTGVFVARSVPLQGTATRACGFVFDAVQYFHHQFVHACMHVLHACRSADAD